MAAQGDEGRRELDRAFDVLERHVPGWLRKAVGWLRSPGSRWVRIPIGLLFIASSTVWFLPVVGIEFLPIGLLLIAQDIPFLRRPMGKLGQWLELGAFRGARWWKGRGGGRIRFGGESRRARGF